MPYVQPGLTDVHVNAPLTNLSVAFVQDESRFVASRVFPTVPVPKASDRYMSYDRGMFNRNEMGLRAPGTPSAGVNYTIDNTPSYSVLTYALHRDIPDQIRANADAPVNLDREATLLLTQKALIQREAKWASSYFAGSIWTSDVDGAASGNGSTTFTYWSDSASTPIEDIRLGRTTVLARTGFMPNKLVIGQQVYDKLVDHPDVVARLDRGQTPNGPAMANREALAALFEVDEVLVMSSIQNTAAEGATNVHSFIGGKKALLVYAPPSPGIMTPSGGYTFTWTGYPGATNDGMVVRTFRMEELRSTRVELEQAYDMKLVAADLGYFWDTIVA